MKHLPVFLDLNDRPTLVVGGGALAVRKVRLIRRAGAQVTVVAPVLEPELLALLEAGEITHEAREFRKEDVQGKALVVAAVGLRAVEGHVSSAARAAGVPVNVVDRPALSTFVMPAIVDRDPIVVAVSSAGTAPVLARNIRARIEAMLPSRIGRLAAFADSFRRALKVVLPDGHRRRRFWERFFDGSVAGLVLSGDEVQARERMLELVNGEQEDMSGRVVIVGAGPGDPDLLTFRAMRAIQTADVIVYDRLIGPDILDYARRDAERVFVGKRRSAHYRTQDEINALLLERAQSGQTVVRLKGGDPFVFGRGGEEADFLRTHGVDAEIVPGITAAVGAAAYAGMPLTHREHASAVTFVTGHAKDGEPDLDWSHLAKARQTIVVYMGVDSVERTSRRLVEHGMAPHMPAAVVENATRRDQIVVAGTVGELPAMVAANGIRGPAVLVIGEVAAKAETRPQIALEQIALA